LIDLLNEVVVHQILGSTKFWPVIDCSPGSKSMTEGKDR